MSSIADEGVATIMHIMTNGSGMQEDVLQWNSILLHFALLSWQFRTWYACAILCNIDNYNIFHASKVKGHGNQQPVVTVTQINKASTFMRSLWLLCSVHAWAEHETLGKYAELRHAKNMPSVSKPFLECLKNCCYKTCWPRNHVETMVTGHLRMRLVCLCLCCFVAMSAAICSTVIAAIW